MSQTDCRSFGRWVRKGLATGLLVAAGACKPHYEGNIPTPDNIPVVDQPRRIVDTNCIIDVYALKEPFAGILQQQGLRAALDSVGSSVPLTPPPTYQGDSPPRDIAEGEYWYPTPLEEGIFSYTSLRAVLSVQLSQCLISDRDFKYLARRDFTSPGQDFASFRNGNDELYVLYPTEKLLIAVTHVD